MMRIRETYQRVTERIKEITGKGLERAILIGAGLSSLFVPAIAYSDAIVKSYPVQQKWRIGETYGLDILANTTEPDVMATQFQGGQAMLAVPDYVSFQNSWLPDPTYNPSQEQTDFFYDFFMNPSFNQADDTLSSGGPAGWSQILSGNVRVVQNQEGPSNVSDGKMWQYSFTINSDAPIGISSNFLMAGVELGDTNSNPYKLSMGNLQIENNQFTYTPRRGDVNGDYLIDAIDVQTFTDVLLGNDTDTNHVSWADTDDNGTTDATDIQPFVDAYIANGQ